MSWHEDTVDLSNCDREPIHQLGRIQDFGALIAVNNDWCVAHLSENVATFFGENALAKDIAVGTNLVEVFSDGAFTTICATLSDIGQSDTARLFGIDLFGDGKKFDCAVHVTANNDLIVLEFEPHSDGDLERNMRLLQPVLARLRGFDDIHHWPNTPLLGFVRSSVLTGSWFTAFILMIAVRSSPRTSAAAWKPT